MFHFHMKKIIQITHVYFIAQKIFVYGLFVCVFFCFFCYFIFFYYFFNILEAFYAYDPV